MFGRRLSREILLGCHIFNFKGGNIYAQVFLGGRIRNKEIDDLKGFE